MLLAHHPSRAPPRRVTPLPPRRPLRRLMLRATAEPTEKTTKKPKAPAIPPTSTTTPPSNVPAPRAKPSFLAKVFDQAVDSAEDIARHLNRLLLPLPTRTVLDKMVRGGRGRYKLQTEKPVVLVCGSGWGAHSIIKVIDTDNFEVVLVSPRNFFFFTPMLPSTAVGTVEFRSLTDPIRTANEYVSYLDAVCTNVDIKRKVAVCRSDAILESGQPSEFEVEYDTLVMAIGEQPATFGVPGVQEHCFFMKEITDAVELRKRIGGNFEYAALPSTNQEERGRALHFIVVGGGPTGVEFSGTLADYVRQDLRRKYPELMPLVRVSLLQSAQSILTMFDRDLQDRAIRQLQSQGVDVQLGVKVVEVDATHVTLGSGERLPYGVCVWSAGNAARPLTQQLIADIPEQQQLLQNVPPAQHKLQVDNYLRVVGAEDLIALGDCSAMLADRLPATAQVAAQQGAFVAHLINRGFAVGRGGLDQAPPRKEEPVRSWWEVLQDGVARSVSESVDLPARPTEVKYYGKQFSFLDLGMMAYVGGDKAATQLNAFDTEAKVFGYGAYFVWRSVYITKQVSFRNRVLILFDWMKAKVFGRDVSLF